MTDASVRPATRTDRPAWIRLRHALWPDCPEEKHRIEIDQLLASDGIVLLAEVSGAGPIGFAEASIRHDHVSGASSSPIPYLEGWYVDERFRHRGVGRALILAVEAWVRDQGYSELASDAETTNEDSIAAHHRLGLREVERTVQFVKTFS